VSARSRIPIGAHAAAATQERRALTSFAVRSTLLTILSEHVMAHREEVWQETLVLALIELGNSEQTARQAVARSIRNELLRSRRVARRARMSLTTRALEILTTGRARVSEFEAPHDWDGTWLVLVLRAPEDDRRQLRQIGTALTRAGMGSLATGVWITPHHARESTLASALRVSGGFSGAVSLRSSLGAIGADGDIAESWPLAAVADRYRAFVARFGRMRASAPAGRFAAHTRLVHEWRRMAFDDPDLPAAVLPRTWPRARAYTIYRECEERWRDGAREHFAALEASVDAAAGAPPRGPRNPGGASPR
jgi:phenylacetic acid degradation operon negative regulatory protein